MDQIVPARVAAKTSNCRRAPSFWVHASVIGQKKQFATAPAIVKLATTVRRLARTKLAARGLVCGVKLKLDCCGISGRFRELSHQCERHVGCAFNLI
mmetsp:Transcript_79525/g.125430  ORF Transcript_79525/g.125430 Transcript_79525/m.125430 type:complete len:97 (+) Transcript_79525:559-849(+)